MIVGQQQASQRAISISDRAARRVVVAAAAAVDSVVVGGVVDNISGR